MLSLAMDMKEIIEEAGDSRILQGASACVKIKWGHRWERHRIGAARWWNRGHSIFVLGMTFTTFEKAPCMGDTDVPPFMPTNMPWRCALSPSESGGANYSSTFSMCESL